MTADIAVFLNAQFDADQLAAENAMHLDILITGRHSPSFVLADIAAKRKLLGAHREDKNGRCRTCARWTTDWVDGFKVDRIAYEGVEAPCLTRRLLALPYAPQPGYDESWRP
jgi:hypothetical protein